MKRPSDHLERPHLFWLFRTVHVGDAAEHADACVDAEANCLLGQPVYSQSVTCSVPVLDESEPLSHVEDLADGVLVPPGPRTRCEVHGEDAESVLVVRVCEFIHPDLASEMIRATGACYAGLCVVEQHSAWELTGHPRS